MDSMVQSLYTERLSNVLDKVQLNQGSHASINVWECYEIWEKKFQDWKCYGNLKNVLENLQNVLEKLLVSWKFLEMVKGAPKCLEFTSEHLETPELPGPLAGPKPPAFWVGTQLSSIFTQRQLHPWYITTII